jgi:hypothetical protein
MIDGSLNSRLYVTSSPILVYLRNPGRATPDTQQLVPPLMSQTGSENSVKHSTTRRWRSTNIRDYPQLSWSVTGGRLSEVERRSHGTR